MKTKFCIILLLGTLLTAPVVVLNAHAQGPPSGAPSSGQLTSLADRWTKLILSIDTATEQNPFTQPYSGDCSQLIQGKTMFLVGQSSSTGPLGTVDHGTCTVPSGTSIFFPLFNAIEVDCIYPNTPKQKFDVCTAVNSTPGQPSTSREQQRETVNKAVEKVDVRSLQSTTNLDGNPIDFGRAQSPPGGFVVKLAANNAFFGDLTSLFNGTLSLHGVVDGYWSLISPRLSTGQISTLTFGGCQADLGCQKNIWHLVVRPGSSSSANALEGGGDTGSGDDNSGG